MAMRHSVRAAIDPVDPFANNMGWSIDFHHRLLGSVVSIRFLLGSHYITSTTVVRNAVPGGWIGVDFIDVSRENEERLAAFIANLE